MRLLVLFGCCLALCVPFHPLSLHISALRGNQPPPVHPGQPVGPLAPHDAPYLCPTYFYGTCFNPLYVLFYEHTLLALCVPAHPLNAVFFAVTCV